MTELKPCPFCGGEARPMYALDEGTKQITYTVMCMSCSTAIFHPRMSVFEWDAYDTEEEAAAARNTRHVETDALREACRELVAYAGTCPFDAKSLDTANWSERCDRECSTDVDMAACWMRYFLELRGDAE